jgi:hypothetical protein
MLLVVHLLSHGASWRTVDFLGFHHHWVRGRTAGSRHLAFLARWPSRQAMQHARDRVRELTARDRLRWPIEQIVGDLNRFLRGWAGYFRYGNSTVQFDRIVRHAERRLQLWIAASYQQPWHYGRTASTPDPTATDWSASTEPSPRLVLTVASGSRMPAVKNVGEPCAGEPHARIDGGREETSTSRQSRAEPGASRLPDQPPDMLRVWRSRQPTSPDFSVRIVRTDPSDRESASAADTGRASAPSSVRSCGAPSTDGCRTATEPDPPRPTAVEPARHDRVRIDRRCCAMTPALARSLQRKCSCGAPVVAGGV